MSSSTMFRMLRQQQTRSLLVKRAYSTAPTTGSTASTNAFIAEREAIKAHAPGASQLWRKITIYVAFPLIVVGYLNATAMMKEHESHLDHIKEENGGELPERVVYPYMNKRIKEYPWGPYTLFYNPHVNIDPEVAEE